MLRIDGSPFDWLEGRDPKAVLIGAIDDATGEVLFLLFRPTEDQIGYRLLLRIISLNYGLPMSICHDRHTILCSPKQPTLEEELAGQTPMSQIQRVMAELTDIVPEQQQRRRQKADRGEGTPPAVSLPLRTARTEEEPAYLSSQTSRMSTRCWAGSRFLTSLRYTAFTGYMYVPNTRASS